MGSRRWFRYVDDEGTARAVNRDESNTELVNIAADTGVSVAGLEPLPQGVTARSVTLSDISGNVVRECIVLTPERYAALNNSVNFLLTAANFSGVATDTQTSIVRKNPELSRRQPRVGDTGQIDGDQE